MKTFIIKTFLLSFFIGAFASFSYGGGSINPLGGAIITDDGGGGQAGCQYRVTFTVYLTNLDVFAPLPNDEIETFPTGHPPMFFRYSINGVYSEAIQLTTFEFHANVDGVNVYKTRINHIEEEDDNPVEDIDLCWLCEDNTNGQIEYTTELLAEDISDPSNPVPNYIPYPACDYVSYGDIFSCLYFTAAGTCLNNDRRCLNDELTYQEGILDFECEDGNPIPTEDPVVGSRNDSRERLGNNSVNELKISAQPNPFKDNFTIQWLENTTTLNISLIDTNGKLVKVWDQNQLKNRTDLYIDTQNLIRGLYFIKVSSSDATEVLKVVKQ